MDGGIEAFRTSLTGDAPPGGADGALAALWWAGKGDWDRAHRIVAAREGEAGCDRVHAFLHRVEGDEGNARYWYRQAGTPAATGSTDAEWRELAGELLGGG